MESELGATATGKVITNIRNVATAIANKKQKDTVLIDSSAGLGCSLIASITGTNLTIIIAEPTLSGINDMKRAIEVTAHFKIPTLAIINKHNINQSNTRAIQKYCHDNKIPVIGMISYHKEIPKYYCSENPLNFINEKEIKREFDNMFSNLEPYI